MERTDLQKDGAVIQNTYLKREKHVIPIDVDDLENLLETDSFEHWFLVIGEFFLVGAIWLGLEKYIEQGSFSAENAALLTICGFSAAVGIILVGSSIIMRGSKRKRIKKIISNCSTVSIPSPQ